MANRLKDVVAQLEEQKAAIEKALAALKDVETQAQTREPGTAAAPRKSKRRLTPEGRRRLAEAMKRRWAAKRSGAQTAKRSGAQTKKRARKKAG